MMARSSMALPLQQKLPCAARRSRRAGQIFGFAVSIPLAPGGGDRSAAEEGLEALARLRFTGEITRGSQRFGALLGREQALQAQGLLDAEARQLVASLRHLQGAVGGVRAVHGLG